VFFIIAFNNQCTVASNKDTYSLYPIKETSVCVFIIVEFCDAQAALHSYAISIIHAKFHLPQNGFFHVVFVVLCDN
jgi:hypothetical protein